MSKSVTFEMFALLLATGLDLVWMSLEYHGMSLVMKYIQHLASHCPINYAAVCIVG